MPDVYVEAPLVSIELRLDNLYVSVREARAQPVWQSQVADAFDTAVGVLGITPLNASAVTSITDSADTTVHTRRLRRETAAPIFVHVGMAIGYLEDWELTVLMSFLSQTGTMSSRMEDALRSTPVFSTVVVTVIGGPTLISTAAPTAAVTSQAGVFDSDMYKWGAAESVLVLLMLAVLTAVVAMIVYQKHNKAYALAVGELSPTGDLPNGAESKKATRRSSIKLGESVALASSGSAANADVCAVGQLEENQDFNRNPHALPYVVPARLFLSCLLFLKQNKCTSASSPACCTQATCPRGFNVNCLDSEECTTGTVALRSYALLM